MRGAFARGADQVLPWLILCSSTAWRNACYGAVCSECHEEQLDVVRAEGVLGAAFPTLSRLRTDWTHIDIDWDSLDLPVPGSLELMRVRQGRANRTASVSLSISPSPLAAKA